MKDFLIAEKNLQLDQQRNGFLSRGYGIISFFVSKQNKSGSKKILS